MLNELLSQLGVLAALFIAFVLYMNHESKKWETRERNQSELYKNIIDQVSERSQRDYSLLKETLEDNRSQMGMLKETMREMKQLSQTSSQAFRDLFAEIRNFSERERCIHKLNNKQR